MAHHARGQITITSVDSATTIYLRGTGYNRPGARQLLLNGESLVEGIGRGLMLCTIDRDTLERREVQRYDTLLSSGVDALVAHLATIDESVFLTLTSFDATIIDRRLVDALKPFGGTEMPLRTGGRWPFAFLGRRGLEEGRALWSLQGAEADAPYAEVATYIAGRDFISGNIARGGVISATAPTDRYEGLLWLDTSTTPPVQRVYRAGRWVAIGDGTQTITLIDARHLDHNKYYPVIIPLIQRMERYSRYNVKVAHPLNRDYVSSPVPAYCTHPVGCYMQIEWEVTPGSWGGRVMDRRVRQYALGQMHPGELLVSQPGQVHTVSVEYIYVRGGSRYVFEVNGFIDEQVAVELRPEGYRWSHTHSNGRIETIEVPVLDSIASIAPKTDLTEVYDRSLAEITRQFGLAKKAADDARRVAEEAVTDAEADGKITEAEARLLGQVYASYRQQVTTSWEGVSAVVAQVLGNEYLVGASKTALSSTQATALASYNTLISRVDSSITDGRVVASELGPIRDGEEAWRTHLASLETAIEVANKAIYAEMMRQASQDAQRRIDNINIGSRNLVLASSVRRDTTSYLVHEYKMAQEWMLGETYSISIWAEVYGQGVPVLRLYSDGGHVQACAARLQNSEYVGGKYVGRFTATFEYQQSHQRSSSRGDGRRARIYLEGNSSGRRVVIYRISIVAGNKPPIDYTPAPEDTEYLTNVLKRGETTIRGGLIATNDIVLSPVGGAVSAYVSGDLGRPAFSAGVSGYGTPTEKAMVQIFHSGHSLFGNMHLLPNGEISFYRNARVLANLERPILRIGGDKIPLAQLIDASGEVIDKAGGSIRVYDDYTPSDSEISDLRTVLIDSIALNKPMFSIRVHGSLEISSYPNPNSSPSIHSPSSWVDFVDGGLAGQSQVEIAVEVDDVVVDTIITTTIESVQRKAISFDRTLSLQHPGIYRVVLRRRHAYSVRQDIAFDFGPVSVHAEKKNDFNEVFFGEGGFGVLYGRERYFDIDKSAPHLVSIDGGLKVRGEVDMSGSLARGEVSALGGIEWCSGARAKPPGYQLGRSQRNSDNSYTIYHSIGHVQYSISVSPYDTRDTMTILRKEASNFTIAFRRPDQARTNMPHRFTYNLEGEI